VGFRGFFLGLAGRNTSCSAFAVAETPAEDQPLQRASQRLLSRLPDGSLLAQPVPGPDPELAIHEIEADGERVEDGRSQAVQLLWWGEMGSFAGHGPEYSPVRSG
jgi:hypothetical protein